MEMCNIPISTILDCISLLINKDLSMHTYFHKYVMFLLSVLYITLIHAINLK